MRIAFAIRDRRNFIGGPAVDAARLLPLLRDRGHDIHALCFWVGEEKAHPSVDKLLEAGIPCRIVRRQRFSEDGVKWILEQLQEIQPDIFVAALSTEGCFAAHWLIPSGIPVVNALYGDDDLNLGRSRYFMNCDPAWRVSGHVTFGDHLAGKLLLDAAGDAPVCAVNGIVIPPEVRATHSKEGRFRCVYVGRLAEEQKQTGKLIESFIRICGKRKDIELHLLGEGVGDERACYDRLVSDAGMTDQITFYGIIRGEQFYQHLASCQALVLLSDSEGLPGAVLDAMSCGLVPVCLRYSGVEDVIEHGADGLIVEDRGEDLEHALDLLMQDHKYWNTLSQGALHTFHTKFAATVIAERWEAFLRDLIARQKVAKQEIIVPDKIQLPAPDPRLLEDKRRPGFIRKWFEKFKGLFGALCLIGMYACGAPQYNTDAETSIDQLTQPFLEAPFDRYHLNKVPSSEECLSKLQESGVFIDLVDQEKVILADVVTYHEVEDSANVYSVFLSEGLFRLWKIAEMYRGRDRIDFQDETVQKVARGFLHYGSLELGRPGNRFQHKYSDFWLSAAAINSYFCFYPAMEEIRTQHTSEESLQDTLYRTLVAIGLESWLVPDKQDTAKLALTDPQRFSKNTWWITGNALAFRPTYACAVMMHSEKMIDVIADMVAHAVTEVSYTTADTAYWPEGITPDGGAWTYGRQNRVWSYPYRGVLSAVERMTDFEGTEWEIPMTQEKLRILLNFIRHSSFYYYKGYIPPFLDRHNYSLDGLESEGIPTARLAQLILTAYRDLLTKEERMELEQFLSRAEEDELCVEDNEASVYCGTRYFFAQEDLVRKTSGYYVTINMASRRVDGVESAVHLGDYHNYFAADGGTLFMRNGNDYQRAVGAYEITAYPGVTARYGDSHLIHGRNLMGHCSTENFAGGVVTARGSCCGFMSHKMRGLDKYAGWPDTLYETYQPWLYGITAHKAFFWFDDKLVALGSGIANQDTAQDGPVHTTLDQRIREGMVEVDGVVLQSGDFRREIKSVGKSGMDVQIRHNGFTYQILGDQTPASVWLQVEQRPARWADLNKLNQGRSYPEESLPMFQLWIDHGRYPLDDTYGYIVWCSDPDTDVPVVLSNTVSCQAVASSDGTFAQAVFYQGDTLRVGRYWFAVEVPSVMSVELTGGEIVFTVCDATMDSSLHTMVIRTNAVLEEIRQDDERASSLSIPLPQGLYQGSATSARYTLARLQE